MSISIKSAGDLFSLQIRGALAAEFASQGKEPDRIQWQLLNGEVEMTARHLAEISCDLGIVPHIGLQPQSGDELTLTEGQEGH